MTVQMSHDWEECADDFHWKRVRGSHWDERANVRYPGVFVLSVQHIKGRKTWRWTVEHGGRDTTPYGGGEAPSLPSAKAAAERALAGATTAVFLDGP